VIPLSVLDLVPVREGGTLQEAYTATARLAQVAEEAGYKRFWVAEHHAMDGIAGGATSVVLAHVGHATSTIRIGSGGIMLPNHNPFVIAEQFGTLDALFPGRIDLGLGRAPGAGPELQRALRKNLHQAAEFFPQDVVELRAYLTGDTAVATRPTPGFGTAVEMWMLGSSLFGADLAAQLGLPYAFASHFAPDHLDAALAHYRQRFRPSPALEHPYVMPAMTVFTAETDAEAELLATSQQQSFVRLRSGTPGQLPPPVPGYRDTLSAPAQGLLAHIGQASAIGSPATVREAIGRFIERTQADEIIVSGATYDPTAREHSLRLTMEAVAG
jgi:luciferase family oxidoreductase group 1